MIQPETRLKVADNSGAKGHTVHQSAGRLDEEERGNWRRYRRFR